MIEPDYWDKCFGNPWKGAVDDRTFQHPAKFSRALIEKIYEHAIQDGFVKTNDTVLDPFGGVALGAYGAALNHLNWQGYELEQKFVDIGNANITMWQRFYKQDLRLTNGDSRFDILGKFDLLVTSPPYQNTQVVGGKQIDLRAWIAAGKPKIDLVRACGSDEFSGYNLANISNIGNQSKDEFWNSSMQVLQRCFGCLKSGAYAIFNVKDFVRNRERVNFCEQWLALCEHVGFVLMHEHRPLLRIERGVQQAIFGEDKTYVTSHKSVFKNIHERKGSPAIDWEVVYCMRKQ